LTGLYQSVRYRVRSYPTFIVAGQKKIVGWDREALEAALQSALREGQGSSL